MFIERLERYPPPSHPHPGLIVDPRSDIITRLLAQGPQGPGRFFTFCKTSVSAALIETRVNSGKGNASTGPGVLVGVQ